MKKFQNENMVASREVYFHTSTSWLLLLFSGIKWVIGVYRGWGLLGLDPPPLFGAVKSMASRGFQVLRLHGKKLSSPWRKFQGYILIENSFPSTIYIFENQPVRKSKMFGQSIKLNLRKINVFFGVQDYTGLRTYKGLNFSSFLLLFCKLG